MTIANVAHHDAFLLRNFRFNLLILNDQLGYWSIRIQVHPFELKLRVNSVIIMWSFLERPWISVNLVYGIPWHSWFLAGRLVFLIGSQNPFLQIQSDLLVDPDTLVVCISGHFLHVVFMFLES